MITPSDTNRRIGVDRRRCPTPALSRYSLFGGRRRASRRATDPRSYYVDQLGAPIWFALASIFLFQILDAVLTIAHLRNGGMELNPFMSALLVHGDSTFLGVKLGISAFGLWFLGIHKNFPLVRPGLAILFALFLGVIGWHFFLALRLI